MKTSTGNAKLIAKNKKAYFLYEISDKYEVGIELMGTEVKSIRQSKISLVDSYCRINKDELFVFNMHIAVYENRGYSNHDPLRKRRLLMHKREIRKLKIKLQQRGFTLVPLSIYFKRGWAKMEIGLAKGKRKFDKRESLKKKDAKKEMRKY